jgi:hypothetical protein
MRLTHIGARCAHTPQQAGHWMGKEQGYLAVAAGTSVLTGST